MNKLPSLWLEHKILEALVAVIESGKLDFSSAIRILAKVQRRLKAMQPAKITTSMELF